MVLEHPVGIRRQGRLDHRREVHPTDVDLGGLERLMVEHSLEHREAGPVLGNPTGRRPAQVSELHIIQAGARANTVPRAEDLTRIDRLALVRATLEYDVKETRIWFHPPAPGAPRRAPSRGSCLFRCLTRAWLPATPRSPGDAPTPLAPDSE